MIVQLLFVSTAHTCIQFHQAKASTGIFLTEVVCETTEEKSTETSVSSIKIHMLNEYDP